MCFSDQNIAADLSFPGTIRHLPNFPIHPRHSYRIGINGHRLFRTPFALFDHIPHAVAGGDEVV